MLEDFEDVSLGVVFDRNYCALPECLPVWIKSLKHIRYEGNEALLMKVSKKIKKEMIQNEVSWLNINGDWLYLEPIRGGFVCEMFEMLDTWVLPAKIKHMPPLTRRRLYEYYAAGNCTHDQYLELRQDLSTLMMMRYAIINQCKAEWLYLDAPEANTVHEVLKRQKSKQLKRFDETAYTKENELPISHIDFEEIYYDLLDKFVNLEYKKRL